MPLFFISSFTRIYSLRRHKASFGKRNNGLTESILVENAHTHTQTNKFRIVTFMRVTNYTLAKWHSLVLLVRSFSFVHFGVCVCVYRLPSTYICEPFWRTHCISVFSIHSCVSWFVFALAFLIYLFVRSNDSKHSWNIALFSVYRC